MTEIVPSETMASQLPESRVVCIGEFVELVRPTAEEADRMVRLRNEPANRRWFFDNRILDPIQSRRWILESSQRTHDEYLAIRWRGDGRLMGTIGWSGLSRAQGSAWFGRIILDRKEARTLRYEVGRRYPGPMLDAAISLRDYAFTDMGLRVMRASVLATNCKALAFTKRVGLRPFAVCDRLTPRLTTMRTVEFALTISRWKVLATK